MKRQLADFMALVSQKGVTLIELVIFMVIVGIAMAGIVMAINFNVGLSADPVVRKQALAIAESMLEEIMLQNFNNPAGGFTPSTSPPPVTERSQFDDIGDYNGYTSSGVYSLDNLSTTIDGLANYTVSVSIDSAANLNGISGGRARLITVTVTGPLNTTVLLQGYRTDYGT